MKNIYLFERKCEICGRISYKSSPTMDYGCFHKGFLATLKRLLKRRKRRRKEGKKEKEKEKAKKEREILNEYIR